VCTHSLVIMFARSIYASLVESLYCGGRYLTPSATREKM
jgi:hypothetical protein